MTIDYITDEVSGISKAIITYKGRTFIGEARLHPDDAWSNFFGCSLAEDRAMLKLNKTLYREAKKKCDACREFVNSLTQYKDFDPDSTVAKTIFRQLNRRIKEVNRLGDEITMCELAIMQHTKTREKVLDLLNKNKSDKTV